MRFHRVIHDYSRVPRFPRGSAGYRQQSTEPVRCELCLPLPDPVVFAVFFLSEYREAEMDRELNPVPMEGAPGSDGGEKECMEKTVKRLRVR